MLHRIRQLCAGGLLAILAITSAAAAETAADLVIVNKARRELLLLRNGDIVRTYRIALGGNPIGHKQQEGDHKTPEGRYVIDSRNPASSYYKALHISYPNKEDIARAKQHGVKPGGAIMIHGLPEQTKFVGKWHRAVDWTDGCVAVSNEEMDEIWRMVPNGTPIQINP